jgi:glycosyltransferase EpsD
MPFNLIEALGCGATVLVSDVKGHVDLIENGVDGFLYSFNNIEDFATKVYKIYRRAISIPMENKIAKYEKYTKDRVFPDTLSVLERTV